MAEYENNQAYRRHRNTTFVYKKRMTEKTWNMFVNACIVCGTAIVFAITVKVIMSLFV